MITYIQPDGRESTVEVPAGVSVMRGAISNDVSGIVAECGGSCACATCHVYVQDGDIESFPEPSEDEDEMLDVTASPRLPNSRLSCQLKCSRDDVQLRVLVPPEQV